jgi:hypothetical protein
MVVDALDAKISEKSTRVLWVIFGLSQCVVISGGHYWHLIPSIFT